MKKISLFWHMIIFTGFPPMKKILKMVKYARTTNLLLMLMVTLAPHTMILTQMVAVTTIPKILLLQETVASAEVEALETTLIRITIMKFVRAMNLLLILMEIHAHLTMMLTQRVAVDTTPKTSLLPENAAYAVVVALDTMRKISLGTCT